MAPSKSSGGSGSGGAGSSKRSKHEESIDFDISDDDGGHHAEKEVATAAKTSKKSTSSRGGSGGSTSAGVTKKRKRAAPPPTVAAAEKTAEISDAAPPPKNEAEPINQCSDDGAKSKTTSSPVETSKKVKIENSAAADLQQPAEAEPDQKQRVSKKARRQKPEALTPPTQTAPPKNIYVCIDHESPTRILGNATLIIADNSQKALEAILEKTRNCKKSGGEESGGCDAGEFSGNGIELYPITTRIPACYIVSSVCKSDLKLHTHFNYAECKIKQTNGTAAATEAETESTKEANQFQQQPLKVFIVANLLEISPLKSGAVIVAKSEEHARKMFSDTWEKRAEYVPGFTYDVTETVMHYNYTLHELDYQNEAKDSARVYDISMMDQNLEHLN